jgi:glucan phosphoethanolaminetransferase (alkaline phosphatase superfamily)
MTMYMVFWYLVFGVLHAFMVMLATVRRSPETIKRDIDETPILAFCVFSFFVVMWPFTLTWAVTRMIRRRG